MMKKVLAVLLALALVFGLTACTGTPAETQGTQKEETTKAAETQKAETEKAETEKADTEAAETEGGDTEPAPAGSDEAYYCELILPVMQPIPAQEEIQRVEDAINDHILNDLGVTDVKMHLTFASLSDYQTNMSMDLAAGAVHDIILAFPFNTWQANGYMTNLDPYLDNELAGAMGVLPKDWDLCGKVDGSIYAIPCYKGLSLSWKWFYDHAYVDGVIDPSTVTALDSLEDALTVLKEKYPDYKIEITPDIDLSDLV